VCVTIYHITPPFCKSLPLGLFASPYYHLSCCSRLLPFPTALFIRLAYKVALGDLGALGRSLEVYKENI
jgi:hypothetical protein